MILTEIGIRKKGLYALTFDGFEPPEAAQLEKENVLLIDRDTLDMAGWRTGRDYSAQQLEELVQRSACNRAYAKALWLLDYRDYTQKAMCEKLQRDFPPFAAEYAAARCAELHMIDDERYAQRKAEILIQNKQVPKKQALYQLMQKGVERDVAEQAVENVPISAEEQLTRLIQKKYALRLQTPEQIKKVTAALARKGFSYYEIQSAIRAYLDREPDEGE